MKTIYRVTTGNFSSPTEEIFDTREEAYNSVNWEDNYWPYNPVIIEKLVLTDDNKIELYECFNDRCGLWAFDNWNAEEEMFIFGDSEDDKCTAEEYFLDSDDNYELWSVEPLIIEEGDDEYEDLILEF